MRAPPSARRGRACRWGRPAARRARRSARAACAAGSSRCEVGAQRASASSPFADRDQHDRLAERARRARRTRRRRATAPLASAASSISVGLMRLPLTLIIASSRPRKRSRPSSPIDHRVARPDFAVAEALGGALRVVPIALARPAARWTSSPSSPGAASLPSGRTMRSSAKGMARADAVGMRVDQRRIEAGRAEGFGEAVHQVQLRLREQRAQAAHQRLGQMAAAVGQRAQAVPRPAPLLLGQLEPQAAARRRAR